MQIKHFSRFKIKKIYKKDLIACIFNIFVYLEYIFKEDVKSHTDVMVGDTEVKRNLTNSNIKY